MNLLRKSLYPLSLIYDIATRVRNAAYDAQWLKQKQCKVPTIVVGNLITGDDFTTQADRESLRYLDCIYMHMGLYGNDPEHLRRLRGH